MPLWSTPAHAQPVAVSAAAPAASADKEAERLGRALARTGTLAAMLPMLEAKDIAELVAAHPELSPAEREQLQVTAKQTAAAAEDKLFAAMGHQYASQLPVAELRVLVAFNAGSAAAHYRAVQPAVIAATMQTLSGFDLKHEALKAFCEQTRKACAAK